MTAVLTFEEEVINAYEIQTNRVNKYIDDLIKADLVEVVE